MAGTDDVGSAAWEGLPQMMRKALGYLFGNNDLERKCRFIFGGGILVLVSMSFSWYGRKTEQLVISQAAQNARRLVDPTIKEMHTALPALVTRETAAVFNHLDRSLSHQGNMSRSDGYVLVPDGKANPDRRPRDAYEAEMLGRFVQAAARGAAAPAAARKPFTFADGTPMEASGPIPGKAEYRYMQAVLFEPNCLNCHAHQVHQLPGGKWVEREPGEFACAAVVRLPMSQINRDINQNRAVLITAALVTAIMAMVGAWIAIRYVIVPSVTSSRIAPGAAT